MDSLNLLGVAKKAHPKLVLYNAILIFFFLLDNLKLFIKLKLKPKLSKSVCLRINQDNFLEN